MWRARSSSPRSRLLPGPRGGSPLRDGAGLPAFRGHARLPREEEIARPPRPPPDLERSRHDRRRPALPGGVGRALDVQPARVGDLPGAHGWWESGTRPEPVREGRGPGLDRDGGCDRHAAEPARGLLDHWRGFSRGGRRAPPEPLSSGRPRPGALAAPDPRQEGNGTDARRGGGGPSSVGATRARRDRVAEVRLRCQRARPAAGGYALPRRTPVLRGGSVWIRACLQPLADAAL